MTYWTIMMITVLNGPMEDSQMYLLYPSMESCEAAILPVTDTLIFDYKVECTKSDTMSKSIRPKKNPRAVG